MTKMDFNDKTLERFYRSFKWARNNTLQILDSIQTSETLEYQPEGVGQHSVLYQFQCLVTTSDTYYRRLTKHDNVQFGVLLGANQVKKEDIEVADIKPALKRQMVDLERVLKDFDAHDFETNVQDIQSLINHEYLHQGQLIVMFRSLEIELPKRFRQAFDL